MLTFYLYIRVLYLITEIDKVVKIGITDNFIERESTYKTGEYIPGYFSHLYKINYNGKRKHFDKKLKELTKKYNKICYNKFNIKGGNEFYDIELIDKLQDYLKQIKKIYKYELLDIDEINEINMRERDNNSYSSESDSDTESESSDSYSSDSYSSESYSSESYSYNDSIIPLQHQQEVLDKIKDYYENNDNGKLIWACGLGKSLMTLFIIKQMKFILNLICVPSITLQKQWKKTILSVFPNKENLLFVGGDSIDGIISTNNINDILKFINKNTNVKFIISTYHSCNILVNDEICFDFKNGDEAHHLVGLENTDFRKFHKIKSTKTLFETATEKIIENNIDKPIYSMEDKTIFGDYIDIKTVHWAIENKNITDYNVYVIKNTEDEVDNIINNLKVKVQDKTIFIACYMCLKTFEKHSDLSHILLYTNTMKESEQAKEYINKILKLNILSIPKDKIYNNALHSNNNKNLNKEIELFKSSPYGIISCVYIFGEGFDLPKINGVCIASNMTSIIRIIQYLLRANRLEKGNPLKKAYQIIPCIDNNLKSYENVRHIIDNMRSVDKSIEQKIKIIVGYKKLNNKNGKRYTYEYNNFEENEKELTKLKMRLRYSKALYSDFSEEQDEYNYVRSINMNLNILSDTDYFNCKDKHEYFIEDPEKYFKSKGVWTNHYHFYGTNTSIFIQTKEEWIKFCKNKNIKSLNDYYNACKIYDELPENPSYLYNNFSTIVNELGKFNNIRRR